MHDARNDVHFLIKETRYSCDTVFSLTDQCQNLCITTQNLYSF